ncbi:MAG: hypothetical protein L0H63_11735 [Nitrococcus sp.]|nr:hypothetical protein [Nitrococcus sp.]
MADNNRVLEQLRALRNEIKSMDRKIQASLSDIKSRLASMEMHDASQHIDSARNNARMDQFEERIATIERRLEISEATPP